MHATGSDGAPERRAGEVDATRAALEQAVRRGGDLARAEIREDADFDGVGGQPWFAEL